MNGFDLTGVSGSLLLTLVGGEFYAISVQHLPISTISLEKCCLEIGSSMWNFRRNWFIWKETEKELEITIINGRATWPLMIIFCREFCFHKAGLTCGKHRGTVWFNGIWLVGIPQYKSSQSCYICFFEKTLLPHPLLRCQCALWGDGWKHAPDFHMPKWE